MNRKQVVIAVCCFVAVSTAGMIFGKLNSHTEDTAEADELSHQPHNDRMISLENPISDDEGENHRNNWSSRALHVVDPNRRSKLTRIIELMIAEIG